MQFSFFQKEKARLGIDIGTAVLKIVELKQEGGRLRLENYGLAAPEEAPADFRTTDLSAKELGGLIKRILDEAKIKTKKAAVSLPVLSTFSVLIEMPELPEKELASAVPFEARKYIPVSLEEVALDWSVIKTEEKTDAAVLAPPTVADVMNKPNKAEAAVVRKKIRILVVAVPKEIINRYTQAVKFAGLELSSLEQEAFSLCRALLKNDPGTYLIVDIGRRGSSVIVCHRGFVYASHVLERTNREAVCEEIKKVVDIFKVRYNKEVKTCFLAGSVDKSDLTSYLKICLPDMETILGNPFSKIVYPAGLGGTLKEIGSSLAVAVGLAMREF